MDLVADEAPAATQAASAVTVRHLRQVLLWPLRLMPVAGESRARRGRCCANMPDSPWRELVDEFTGERRRLPRAALQRVRQRSCRTCSASCTAKGARAGSGDGERLADARVPPARRRARADHGAAGRCADRRSTSCTSTSTSSSTSTSCCSTSKSAPTTCRCARAGALYRFGRAYPGGWDDEGQARALHGERRVARRATAPCWRRPTAQQREAFLAHVCRAPRAAHRVALGVPAAAAGAATIRASAGLLRFRQIEYYRMPLMAYLALDDPRRSRARDFVRLGLVTGAAGRRRRRDALLRTATSPTSSSATATTGSGPKPARRRTRATCASGHALVVVGDACAEFFGCRDRGVLAQFRHQHFLLFLIAHFQKAALLMFSDRLVEALNVLDVGDADSVKRFKRAIRSQLRRLPALHAPLLVPRGLRAGAGAGAVRTCARSISTSIRSTPRSRSASRDMNSYLDADSLRRQANTVVRLTVVTIFGLIGTVATGRMWRDIRVAAARVDAACTNASARDGREPRETLRGCMAPAWSVRRGTGAPCRRVLISNFRISRSRWSHTVIASFSSRDLTPPGVSRLPRSPAATMRAGQTYFPAPAPEGTRCFLIWVRRSIN